VVLIEDLTVYAAGVNSVYLTFTPTPLNGETLSLYRIAIQRSEVNTDNTDVWSTVDIVTADNTDYTDISLSGFNYNKFRDLWYRARAYQASIPNNVSPLCDKKSIAYDPDLYALEIIRQQTLALQPRYAGQNICVLRKRSTTDRCDTCWDAVLQRVNDPDCSDCYGTGFTTGYYASISGLATISADSKNKQINQFGAFEESNKVLHMGPFPFIYPQDIIEDQFGRRWRVNQVNTEEKNGQKINQSAQIAEIDREDIIYTIEIP